MSKHVKTKKKIKDKADEFLEWANSKEGNKIIWDETGLGKNHARTKRV